MIVEDISRLAFEKGIPVQPEETYGMGESLGQAAMRGQKGGSTAREKPCHRKAL